MRVNKTVNRYNKKGIDNHNHLHDWLSIPFLLGAKC